MISTDQELVVLALEARKKAYSPYSEFAVGAALLVQNGHVYTGCNIESASYSATICAERAALFKAVSEGERGFCAMAVVGGRQTLSEPFATAVIPCGVCLQALSEFVGGDFRFLLVKSRDTFETRTMDELFPWRFSSQFL
ncbi:MAG: cytidine deaminase [Oscillospiraceae bacterium]